MQTGLENHFNRRRTQKKPVVKVKTDWLYGTFNPEDCQQQSVRNKHEGESRINQRIVSQVG